jgi:hypothetical protein
MFILTKYLYRFLTIFSLSLNAKLSPVMEKNPDMAEKFMTCMCPFVAAASNKANVRPRCYFQVTYVQQMVTHVSRQQE